MPYGSCSSLLITKRSIWTTKFILGNPKELFLLREIFTAYSSPGLTNPAYHVNISVFQNSNKNSIEKYQLRKAGWVSPKPFISDFLFNFLHSNHHSDSSSIAQKILMSFHSCLHWFINHHFWFSLCMVCFLLLALSPIFSTVWLMNLSIFPTPSHSVSLSEDISSIPWPWQYLNIYYFCLYFWIKSYNSIISLLSFLPWSEVSPHTFTTLSTFHVTD